MRLVLGLIKGIIIGGLVGLGAYQLGMTGGFHWLTYGVVGAMVGLVAGRPIWKILGDKDATIWVIVLKSVVGYLIGIGLYAIVAKAWGGTNISMMEQTRNLYDWQPMLGAIIGGTYGAFVEWDDAEASPVDKSGN